MKNVILDLDNTIISAEALSDFPFDQEGIQEKTLQFKFHDMDGYYIVFERPHLQEFLDWLFENFNVSVFTAATQSYCMFIVENIILTKPGRQLDHILFSDHCQISKAKFNSSKDLKLLWEICGLDNFNAENTIIIDDYDDVYDAQPECCILIHPFNFLDENNADDNVLMEVIKPELEKRLLGIDNEGLSVKIDFTDETPLNEENFKLESIKQRYKRGENINEPDEYGNTLLMHASARGDIESAVYLLSVNADLDLRNEDGETAYDLAMGYYNIDIVKLLLEAGMEINPADVENFVKKNDTEIIKLYVDTERMQADETHLLEIALDNNSKEMLKLLVDAIHTDEVLLDEINENNTDRVELLLESGVEDARNDDGLTGLEIAVENNNLEMVKLLLDYKFRVDVSAMHRAETESEIELLIKFVMDMKSGTAKLRPQDEKVLELLEILPIDLLQQVLLNISFPWSYMDLKFLRYPKSRLPEDFEILIGTTDRNMIRAAEQGRLDVIKYLEKYGGDIHMQYDMPLYEAVKNGHLDVVMYLVSKGGFPSSKKVSTAILKGHLDIVKYFVSQGANVREDDYAVRWASQNGHPDMVEYLRGIAT